MLLGICTEVHMTNKPVYHEGMRQLQDTRETRQLADRMEQVIFRDALSTEDRAFIEHCSMVFVATANAEGFPECSYKGGVPGFVQVLDARTLAIPDYDGNGMYRSWGNVLVNPRIGLLFVDFELQKRIRVNGSASVLSDDPLRETMEGAFFVVRVNIDQVFPNCSRYIHTMQMSELSNHAPRACHTPPAASWKADEDFRDYLPSRDRPDSGRDT